jgi:ATP-binding cassette subfamily B protein
VTAAVDSPRAVRARLAWDTWVERAVISRVEIARMVPRAGRPLAAPLIAMNLVSGALPVAFVVATSVVIGRVPAAVAGGVGSSAWDALVSAFLFAAGAFLLARIIAPVVAALASRVRRRIDGELREEILALTSRTASIAPMEDQDVLDELGESIRQFDDDWNTPGQAVAGLLALLSRYGSLVSFCALASLASFWWAGPVVFLTTMMFRYGNRGGLRRFSAVWRTVMPQARKRDYLRELSLGDRAAKETRIFGLNAWLIDRYRRSYWDVFGPVGRARRRIYFYPYLLITSVGLVVLAWVVLRIGQAAAEQRISLTALALSLQAVMGAIALGSAYEEADVPTQFGMRAIEAMRALRTHIERAEERERAQTAANVAREPLGARSVDSLTVSALPRSSLVFHQLRFAYPGTSEPVLDGLDLEIPAGRSTAIVGVNGAGKTTLVKLLSRLYEPTGGAILADGVNIGRLDVGEWRRQVSVIFQDFIKYEFTAADNIAMGAIHAPRDDAAIRDSAHRAGILDAFDRHPLGLDTPLARAYQGGTDLSGGQWQRVAIARSLYALREGAKILVLDEPTSALDVRAEVAFFDRFVELTHGVTSILISHRFSSVRRADHIVVIDGGKVGEQGSHAQLMKSGGHYARLFTLQAERFAKGLSAEGEVEDAAGDDAAVEDAAVEDAAPADDADGGAP